MIPDVVITNLYREINNSFESLQRLTEDVIYNGYQPDVLIFQLFDFLASRQEISDIKKARIMETLGEADYGLIAGGNEYLQIVAALTAIQKIIRS